MAARTRVAAAPHRPPPPEEPPEDRDTGDDHDGHVAGVIPLDIFDARAVADRWPS
jgi:hypothetical protein